MIAPNQGSTVWLAISGHQVIPAAALTPVITGLRKVVTEAGTDFVGLTSLAAGSDQMFAQEVLSAGGRLHAVLPCQNYESTQERQHVETYRQLLEQSDTVETLSFPSPSEQAFYAAGRRVVDLCQMLVAVWDGQPSRGLGGTADVVSYAHDQGREVRVIWPVGMTR